MPLIGKGAGRGLLYNPPVVVAGGVVTLDSGAIGTNPTLSNGDLTITNTSTRGSARSTTSRSSGKYYYEVTCTSGGGGFDQATGIGNASMGLNNSPNPGSNTNSVAKYLGSANVLINNATVGTTNTATVTSTICVAVDFTNNNIWFRIGSGNWNANVANDPATNTGGISLSTLAAGPYFIYVAVENSGFGNGVATINFGATAFSQTAPSGFGNW